MPFDEFDKLGPLRPLVGTWEGEGGVDVSFHHADGEVDHVAPHGEVAELLENAHDGRAPGGALDGATVCRGGR